MEFQNNNDSLNFIQRQFDTEPCINVISKDQFEERIKKVFTILWERLSMSFGPGGAGSFISIYPKYYNTKDGFSIMKNIAFDKKLDQVISDMVMTICSRLNFTVGDGTTTAVIATKSAYDSYIENKDFFDNKHLLPRYILGRLEYFKNAIIKELDKEAIPIRTDDPKELRKNIEKVVYISSNGNKELTEMIGSLYEQLMYPAITVALSHDGTMKSSIVSGYKLDIALTDKLYINNDNDTMLLNGTDVIMFDHKVMKETYELILKPLSEACKERGRHLVCIAPFYDENALAGVIKTDLTLEYKKEKDINLVLACCSKATGYTKILLEDLAMLFNTQIISSTTETDILNQLRSPENNGNIYSVFDIDDRKIKDIIVAYVKDMETHTLGLAPYTEGLQSFNMTNPNLNIRIGYCDNMELGLKISTFSGFYYDKEVYNKYLSVAKKELEEVRKKCEQIGTYSIDLNQKQQRVYSLGLKNGLIEVGSSSDITEGYLKDTVDDAVKAAASAYNNGVVLGCNVTLIKAIEKVMSQDWNDVDHKLLYMLMNGYKSVYKTVLKNVFENVDLTPDDYDAVINKNKKIEVFEMDISDMMKEEFTMKKDCMMVEFSERPSNEVLTENKAFTSSLAKTAYDLIIDKSIQDEKVLNIESMKFSNEVINSTETDREILKATVDLLGLLITGNQLVIC